MTGIADLFAELSQPDEFHVQAQLELFGWRERKARRERQERFRFAVRHTPVRWKTRLDYQREWRARRRKDPAWRQRQVEHTKAWRASKRAEARAA